MDASSKPSISTFLLGIRDQLPILLGVVPFGLIFGALAVATGLSTLEAQAFSLILFAGSAQFISVSMLAEGSPVLVILATIFIVNLRHALYSATLAPRLENLSARWRALLGWLLTDEAFATTATYVAQKGGQQLRWYLLGTGLALWSSWQVSTAFGALVGGQMPVRIPLEFALPLTFIALLAPTLRDRATLAAAVVATAVALLFWQAPYHLGLLAGILAGVSAGVLSLPGEGVPDDVG